MGKLKSRKFWIAVASMFASVSAAVAGFSANEQLVTIVGIICTIASGAIFNFCETVVDVEAEEMEALTSDNDVQG